MLLHIAVGTKFSLLFARPQAHANRAPRLHVQRIQNAHHFHRHDRSRAVVGRAGRGGPRIEVPADHHDFIFQLRIGAGNFGDRVEAVLVIAGEFRFHIHLDGDRHVRFQQPVDAAITFNRHDDDGKRLGVLALVGEPAHAATAIVENRSAGSAVVAAIAAGDHDSGERARRRKTVPPSRGTPAA